MMAEPNNEDLQIFLDGIRLSQQLDNEYLPGLYGYEHQLKSEKLIKNEKSFFLFNHSPTGSGKTISWLKPALDDKMKVIAIYPTNALVIDQKMQVENVIKNFGYIPSNYHVQAVTGDLLEKERDLYSDESGLTKGQLFNRIIRKSRGKGLILLTNPDILTLALKDAYYEHNIRESVRSVDMIVVDEFHLASIKQSDMLLYMMHEINDDVRSRLSKFVFLSATPQKKILERARKVGLNVIVLDDKSTPLSSLEGKAILPELNLLFKKGSIFNTYEIIKENIKYFMDFCTKPLPDGKKAKTVFILDGITEVDEIYSILKDSTDLRIERIDGLHPATPEKLKSFDVLISNSSVEVGIDFNVDRLVFTGYSASSFIQRMGRLRNKPQDETCEAICFVPEVVVDHLKNLNGKTITRQELKTQLETILATELDLSSYSKIYSPIEAFLYLSSRMDGRIWYDKNGVEHHDKGMPEAIIVKEYLRTLHLITKHFLDEEIDGRKFEDIKNEAHKLKEGLLSYRGNHLQALIFDNTDRILKLYDLMYLLRRGIVEFMSPQKFTNHLRNEFGLKYDAEIKPIYESKKRFAAGILLVFRYFWRKSTQSIVQRGF
jgi:CRISPR-associated endonuclease/helicase Cas3